MATVIVQTNDGREVSRFEVPRPYPGNGVWGRMLGRLDEPLGWLGRSLQDAEAIEDGRDPERPSEKAVRLATAAQHWLLSGDTAIGPFGSRGEAARYRRMTTLGGKPMPAHQWVYHPLYPTVAAKLSPDEYRESIGLGPWERR